MSDIFRDRTEGAAARRLELLRRRRNELVTMPHAVRRVVVARSARTAASIAVLLVGALLLVVAQSPTLSEWLGRVFPGTVPAVLSDLLIGAWVAGIITYTIARSASEHRFAVAMSRFVLPGEDLDHDLERLSHEHPDAMAKEMAHRLEVRSAALPVAAAAVLIPTTLFYVIEGVTTAGWPSLSVFEGIFEANAHQLAIVAAIGLVASLVMTKQLARVPRVALIAGGLAVASGAGVVVSVATLGSASAWLLAPVVITSTVAFVVRRLRLERELIDAEDPAAGSEMFTIRGAVDGIRRGLAAIRARTRRSTVIVAAVAVLAAAGAVTPISTPQPDRVAEASPPAQAILRPARPVAAELAPPRPASVSRSHYRIQSIHAKQFIAGGPSGGAFLVEATFENGDPIEIPALAGLAVVPRGWHAEIDVLIDEPAGGGTFSVTPFLDQAERKQLTERVGSAHFSADVCGARGQALGLRIEPGTLPPGRHTWTFIVQPTLEPAWCDRAP